MTALILVNKHYSCGAILNKNQIVEVIRKSGKWVVKSPESHIFLSLNNEDFKGLDEKSKTQVIRGL